MPTGSTPAARAASGSRFWLQAMHVHLERLRDRGRRARRAGRARARRACGRPARGRSCAASRRRGSAGPRRRCGAWSRGSAPRPARPSWLGEAAGPAHRDAVLARRVHVDRRVGHPRRHQQPQVRAALASRLAVNGVRSRIATTTSKPREVLGAASRRPGCGRGTPSPRPPGASESQSPKSPGHLLVVVEHGDADGHAERTPYALESGQLLPAWRVLSGRHHANRTGGIVGKLFAVVLVIIGLLAPAAAQAAPPGNDNRASAQTLGSLPATVRGTTVDATLEETEPFSCQGQTGRLGLVRAAGRRAARPRARARRRGRPRRGGRRLPPRALAGHLGGLRADQPARAGHARLPAGDATPPT